MSNDNAFRLDGKVALVTGAARGLGLAITEHLLQAGARVVLADILAGEGEKAAARLGSQATFVALDVTREADWENAVALAIKRFGGLDVVCNNAGVEHTALFENTKLEDFRRVQEINVQGTFLGIKHAIRAMKPGGPAGRGGSIVSISSGAGFKGSMALGAYCASKGSVRLLSQAAAVECAKLNYGIRLNTVHPGMIKTEMGAKTLNDFVELGLVSDVATAEALFAGAHLLGLGAPEHIARAVQYLASDAASWMTGVELPVDGGYAAS
jgi:3alpha(or 20beta)-hydroxysteroid dehydrogenase